MSGMQIGGHRQIGPTLETQKAAESTKLEKSVSDTSTNAEMAATRPKKSSSMPSLGKIGRAFSNLPDGHVSLKSASESNVGKVIKSAIKGILNATGARQNLDLSQNPKELKSFDEVFSESSAGGKAPIQDKAKTQNLNLENIPKEITAEKATKEAKTLENKINTAIKKAETSGTKPPIGEIRSLMADLKSLSNQYDPKAFPATYIDLLDSYGKKICTLLPPPKERSEEQKTIRQDTLDMTKKNLMVQGNHALNGFIRVAEMKETGILFDKFCDNIDISKDGKKIGEEKRLKTPEGEPLPKEAIGVNVEKAKGNIAKNNNALGNPGVFKDTAIANNLPPEASSVILLMITCADKFCKEMEAKNPNHPDLAEAKEQQKILEKNMRESRPGEEKVIRNYNEISSAVATLANLVKQHPELEGGEWVGHKEK